jgi:hypothetical protein
MPRSFPMFQQPWPDGGYRFFQLGFAVDDLLAAAADWARVFGIGPFHVMPRRESPCTYRGEASAVDMQVAVAQAGPVQIELIQQFCDRPSVYRDLFPTGPPTGGSGFHQLCTVTADYDATIARYATLGYENVCEFVVPGQRVAYVDTTATFGFFTEVVEETPQFLGHLAAIDRTCAEWDGVTDPVRLLTRDGYRTP